MSELTFGEEVQSLIAAYSDLVVRAGEVDGEREKDPQATAEAIEVGERLIDVLTAKASEYRESVALLRGQLAD
ncbi:hypothetical protein [Actinoalloteichus hymeniacidonis]|uniref:Uncharacterized protein n=1 Tax=Actinoalloteichus hymeniacidonis TaxID=340345 RepID=A0AAC9MVR9_9PSEU|nr:hypothetical protein [Actinoalloteichus hymeniacidonis]AOS61423.1 hypothetical protein TL08_02945 [Actinoalloteichus hymeniacidonis]MBB5910571.1 hypothetical protein [Actinoalloteichus hymeniacidonis]